MPIQQGRKPHYEAFYLVKLKFLLHYLNSNLYSQHLFSSGSRCGEAYIDYIHKSLNQILLGNYTEDETALGTLGQMGLGFTGLDLSADIRDVSHDIANWTPTWEHAGKTLLDAIGLIPVVGVLKNADEAAGLAKVAIKQSD